MDNLRYMELIAESGEHRLALIDSTWKSVEALITRNLGSFIKASTWKIDMEAMKEAFDELTHDERKEAEKAVMEYEAASRITHQHQELTHYAGAV
jgi:hypothetical protein